MWKVLSKGIHMWNMKTLSFAVHKVWPRLKFLSMNDDNNDDARASTIVLRTFVSELKIRFCMNKQIRRIVVPARQQLWPWRRSKVKVKVTTKVKVKVTTWRPLKGLVTRIMHAKYQCSTFNTSEDMSQVKVFVTDRRRDGQTDGQMRFNVPTLSRKRGANMKQFRNLSEYLLHVSASHDKSLDIHWLTTLWLWSNSAWRRNSARSLLSCTIAFCSTELSPLSLSMTSNTLRRR